MTGAGRARGAAADPRRSHGLARYAASASDAAAAAAANEALAGQGGAVDAVLAAYFAWAGQSAGALLAPAVALVTGAGAGARAFDGRALQPGSGVGRPRGAAKEGEIADASLAAIPRAPQMATLLHAARGRLPLAALTRRGAALAEEAGATRRAAFLRRFADSGGIALRKAGFTRAAIRVAGPNAGGLVTEEDLEAAFPSDEPARVDEAAGATGAAVRIATAPWPEPVEPKARPGAASVVVAADGWGVVAALVSIVPPERPALVMGDSELALPPVAIPVRRGKTRVRPRTVLPSAAPIVLVDFGPALRVALGATRWPLDIARQALAAPPIDARLSALSRPDLIAVIAETGGARVWGQT